MADTCKPFRWFRRMAASWCLGVLVSAAAFAAAPRAGITDSDIAAMSASAAATPSSTAPAIRPDDPPGVAALLGRMALALGTVFALMAGVLWAARRWLPRSAWMAARTGPARGIEVLANRPLGRGRSLVLVRVGDRSVLVGVTPQSIRTLSEFEPTWPAAEPSAARAWHAAATDAGLFDEPAAESGTAEVSR